MHPSINFGDIPSLSISHAHPKTPRPTKKKKPSVKTESEKLTNWIYSKKKISLTVTLLRKPFKKDCSSMDSVLVMQIEQNKHLPASVAVVVCMNMLYTSMLEMQMQERLIQFEGYKGFKLVTHPNFPCKTVNQWDQLEVVLHFYTGTG